MLPVLGKRAPGNHYAIIATGVGDITVGHVSDPTMAQAALDGITVTQGNAYLQTTAVTDPGKGEGGGAVEAGDLFFTARGAAGPQIVNAGSQIFTAVAAGQLVIDGPGSGAGGVFTALVSDTGVVTSVGTFSSYDGRFPNQASVPKIGPRMILTPPSSGPSAATTAEVTPPAFMQQIEIAYGSTGESHFIFQFVWADVKNPPDAPPLPDSVPGTVELPEVFDLQSAGATQIFTHQFAPVFLTANPTFPDLPTSIRMFNDPAINLFAAGGDLDLNQATTQVGADPEVTGNFVTARFVAGVTVDPLPPVNPRTLASPIETGPVTEFSVLDRPTRRAAFSPAFVKLRVLDYRQGEVIRYGPVELDKDGELQWLESARGLGWPHVWTEGRTGNWIERIQHEIARGAWDLGQRFQIRSETDRGKEIIEGWEFRPPGAQFDEGMLHQDVPDTTRPPIEQESVAEPDDSVEVEQSPPDFAYRFSPAELGPALDNSTEPPAQLASLGMALALVRHRAKETAEHLSPARVAEAMDRVEHQGFSQEERRRRLVRRLRELTGQ
jgi:hypothetical protein